MTEKTATPPSPTQPPKAPERPIVHEAHGVQRIDEFAWMADREDPELRPHLEAENRHFEALMGESGAALQRELYAEMKARIPADHDSEPQKDGPYWYWTRQREGYDYSQHCRQRGGPEGPDPSAQVEVYLDENQLAEGLDYFALEGSAVSPDHRLLAYAVDREGDEISQIKIIDLETGEQQGRSIDGCTGHVCWTADGAWLLYQKLDHAHRPHCVYAHPLGSDGSRDRLIYEEGDEAFHLGTYASRSEAMIVIDAGSQSTSELRVLLREELDPQRQLPPQARLLVPRQQGVEASVVHAGDHVYQLTNRNAPEFCVTRLAFEDLKKPVEDHEWHSFIAHDDKVYIEGIEGYRQHLLVWERVEGLSRLRVIDLQNCQPGNDGRLGTLLTFEDAVHELDAAYTAEWASTSFRVYYESLRTPPSLYAFQFSDLSRKRLRTAKVIGGHDEQRYACERIWATSQDGTRVPISLVYRRREPAPGKQPGPLLLYGYGAYGEGMPADFSRARLSLLDRGYTFAIAHVRGGDEMGRQWYEQGRLAHKHNSFDDFIACAEHLVAEGYTQPEQLAIEGGSAGGLLVGAATNLRPDLFHVVLAEVPFIDVLTSMSQPDLPLTVVEYEEWGNPGIEQDFKTIATYSPYDNIQATDYPHMFILGALADPRVGYWEPAKWAARLRKRCTGTQEIALWMHLHAGHSGKSGRFAWLEDLARAYAFMLRHIPGET